MTGKQARIVFLAVCAALAVSLLTQILSPTAGACVFAAALVGLGAVSSGFRRKPATETDDHDLP